MKTPIFLLATLLPLTAQAQNFTTAAEVKPIIEATRANWIAVRNYDGHDLIYFTNPLSWRCGLNAIRYSVNDETDLHDLAMEPCYESEAMPNALKFDQGVLPYISLPPESVKTVHVVIVLDDGSEMPADFTRAEVMTP